MRRKANNINEPVSPSHGRGHRFNPYSAHHPFPDFSGRTSETFERHDSPRPTCQGESVRIPAGDCALQKGQKTLTVLRNIPIERALRLVHRPAHALLARMLVMLRLTAPEGAPATAAARQLVASACGEPGWPQLVAAHDAARQEVGDWWAAIRSAAPQKEKDE